MKYDLHLQSELDAGTLLSLVTDVLHANTNLGVEGLTPIPEVTVATSGFAVLDEQPHALVIYTDPDPDENGRWVRGVHGPFANKALAEAEGRMLSHYSGVEYDVQRIEPPFSPNHR